MKGNGLRRDLGLIDAIGIGLGAIVGAGIFVVTGLAAGIAGPAILVSLLIAGLAAAANALSSAQLAAAYPQSGGTYEYGYQTLNAWAGFAAGWMFLASKIAAAGTVALGLAAYLTPLLPGVQPRFVAVAAVIAFTALNYFGIRRSSVVNLVIVAFSVGSLTLFAGIAFTSFDSTNLTPFAPSGGRGILEASALLFFAYTGYARIATLGEEVREPRRTIPRAVMVTITAAMVLYVLVAAAAIGAAGSAKLAETNAPLRVAAQATGVSWLVAGISSGAVCAMLGVILSQILGLSRMVFAMARRGDLPRSLAAVHEVHAVPRRAVLVVGTTAAIVAAFGTLDAIAMAASFTILVYYGIANAAALRMPRASKLYPDVVPLAGLVMCAILAVSLHGKTIAAGVAILAAGLVVRVLKVWLWREGSNLRPTD